MGTRNVTTVFAVEGESDYKKAIQNINREIQTLNAKLDLNATHFKGQEDSMKAIETKAQDLNDLYFKQEEKVNKIRDAWNNCKDTAEKYRQKIKETESAIDEAKKKLEKMDEEGLDKESDLYKAARESYEKLTKTLSNEQAKLDAAVRGAQNWETALYNAQKNLEETEQKIDPVMRELSEKLTPSFEDAGDAIHDVTEKADEMERDVPQSLDTIASAVSLAGIDKAFEKIRDSIQACIDKSIEFETAVTGVYKVYDMTAAEEEAMAEDIKSLAERIPFTTTEIAQVVETAGQLGIAKSEVMDFAEVMLMMGAATNVSAEEAAQALAKFSNIMGITSDDYEKLGSAIVELGNNNATQEDSIIEFATRMASTSNLVGLSVPDVLAYATALNSVGIEAEAGGTAISKLFKDMEKTVELSKANGNEAHKFSDFLGIDPEEFNSLWDSDAASAINMFIKGLSYLDESGGSVVVTLADMGYEEVRLSNAIQALVSDTERLDKVFDEANSAWDENSALAEEAGRRYETSASKIQILDNTFSNLKIAIGDDIMDTAEPLIEWLTKLASAGADLVENEPAFSDALIAVGGGLAAILGVTGVAGVIKGVAGALSLLGPHSAAIAAVAGAVGMLATDIIEFVTASNTINDGAQNVIDANKRIMESLEEERQSYDLTNSKLDINREKIGYLIEDIIAMTQTMDQTPESKDKIKESVDELNELLPGLGLTYDDLTEDINLSRQEMEDFADQMIITAKISALQDYIKELTQKELELEAQNRLTTQSIADAQDDYEEAKGALDEFNDSCSWLEQILKWTRDDYLELETAEGAAKTTLDALKDSQNDIQTELGNTNDLLTDAKDQLKYYLEAMQDTADGAKEAGGDVAQGFADGIEENQDIVIGAAKKIAKAAEKALKDGLEIKSPSRVARRLGEYFGEGLALGLEESEQDVYSAAQALSEKLDISADLEERFRKANSSITSLGSIGRTDSPDYETYRSGIRLTEAIQERAIGISGDGIPIEISVIQQLDGEVLSKTVSRTQWKNNQITLRANGISK